MAFKYRQVKPADGDIIDPEDLNANNREFVNEFNGYLDRDNIEFQSLEPKHCKRNAFNKIYSDFKDTTFTLDGSTIDYSRIVNTALVINKITFEAPTDGLLICEWSGTWEFASSLSATDPDASEVQLVTIRLTVNNNELTRIYKAADGKQIDSGYMCGTFEAAAGINIVEVEARTYKSSNTSGVKVVAGNNVTLDDRELIVNFRKR
jgi:hypothetical protein